MSNYTVLYIISDVLIERYGGKYFTKQFNNETIHRSTFTRISYSSEFIIMFTRDGYSYIKNRYPPGFRHSEKEIALMLLRSKEI